MKSATKRLGLALSGGGYRASAFHLGTLKKLQELGILDQVDVLSTISGGSITGAAWCLTDKDYASFHQEMEEKIRTKNVIRQVFTSGAFLQLALFVLLFLGGAIALTFTRWAPWSFVLLAVFFFLLLRFQFQIFPVSRVIEKAYNRFFYNGKTLGQLKSKPLLAIGSSNLHTGRPFTFSQKKMGDSSYSYHSEFNLPITFKQESFPVARAVVASSCVPFAFTPVLIAPAFYSHTDDAKRIYPVLVDGGVYDNQGIQKLTQPGSSYECDLIIVSDAGGNFLADKKYPNTLQLLLRTVDLFMYRIKTSQMVQNVYRNTKWAAKPIAYFSLGWQLENCIPGFVSNMIQGQVPEAVLAAHNFTPAWLLEPETYRTDIITHLEQRTGYKELLKNNVTAEQWAIARSTGTNLTCLSADQVRYLVQHAENLTELQVKLYCPSLLPIA